MLKYPIQWENTYTKMNNESHIRKGNCPDRERVGFQSYGLYFGRQEMKFNIPG